MPEKPHPDTDHAAAFYRVRQTLGWLGLLLPVVLIAGGWASLHQIEPSISDYYHTILRDVLVGVMCAIGLFLLAYPGHKRQSGEWLSDDALTSFAGLMALGLALFPNDSAQSGEILAAPQMLLGPKGAAMAHYACAIAFLTALGALCRTKFARTANPARRRLYLTCGAVIWAATLAVIAASYLKIQGPPAPQAFVTQWLLVLWFEAIAIWAFALAWLVKGRADLALRRRKSRPPHPLA